MGQLPINGASSHSSVEFPEGPTLSLRRCRIFCTIAHRGAVPLAHGRNTATAGLAAKRRPKAEGNVDGSVEDVEDKWGWDCETIPNYSQLYQQLIQLQ